MKIARVLKYNEAQSETTTVDINDNKIAPASLQVLSWPSCLTDTPNSGPETASNASCPITNIAPALKYKQLQSETASVQLEDSKPPPKPPACLQVID